MKQRDLYENLMNYVRSGMISFHTPGHKGVLFNEVKDFLSLDVVTELPISDSLYESKGVLLEAEERMSKVFNTERTCFSAGGCTLCIQAMIRRVSMKKNKIILGRTIHKSAMNTIALLGLDPYFVMPRNDSGTHLPGRIHPEDVANSLKENNDVCAVYITSPDYFGVMSDIRGIAEECKKYNVPLIVDNAHGTHLKFLEEDMHPITLGAAMSADSAHKTLPVLTGGALLQIGDKRFKDEIKSSMSIFGSTSPSYLIMTSLDLCRNWLEKHGKREFIKLQHLVQNLKENFLSLGIDMPIGLCDPIRLSLCTESIGINGIEAADFLREHGIEPEYANICYIVFIITPMNTEQELNKLYDVFLKMISQCSKGFKMSGNVVNTNFLPVKHMKPRDALFSESRFVKLSDALNMICAETISPCPPGIPVVMPGEVISQEVVSILEQYGVVSVKVLEMQ